MMKREGAGQEGDELDLNNFEGDAKEILLPCAQRILKIG